MSSTAVLQIREGISRGSYATACGYLVIRSPCLSKQSQSFEIPNQRVLSQDRQGQRTKSAERGNSILMRFALVSSSYLVKRATHSCSDFVRHQITDASCRNHICLISLNSAHMYRRPRTLQDDERLLRRNTRASSNSVKSPIAVRTQLQQAL